MTELRGVGPSSETESQAIPPAEPPGSTPSPGGPSDDTADIPSAEENGYPNGDEAEVSQTEEASAVEEDSPPGEAAGSQGDAQEAASDLLTEFGEQLTQILSETKKYNTRAAQREQVIDSMHVELERLRRGERRSLLRPLITEICRLRDDILRQADTLPHAFDSAKAAELLRSYADSLVFALEDNGVCSYVPEVGDEFEATLHRASGRTPTTDARMVGKVASVVSPGYRDLEAERVIAPARVSLYAFDGAPNGDSAETGPSTESCDPELAAAAQTTEPAPTELSTQENADRIVPDAAVADSWSAGEEES
jgi:molecular chaperone GrpE (heat shock protein)